MASKFARVCRVACARFFISSAPKIIVKPCAGAIYTHFFEWRAKMLEQDVFRSNFCAGALARPRPALSRRTPFHLVVRGDGGAD